MHVTLNLVIPTWLSETSDNSDWHFTFLEIQLLLKASGEECKLRDYFILYSATYTFLTVHSIWYLPKIIFAKGLLICIKGAIICSCQLEIITTDNKTIIINFNPVIYSTNKHYLYLWVQ